MKELVKIEKVFPIEEFETTGLNGQPQRAKKQGLLLNAGTCKIYAEAYGGVVDDMNRDTLYADTLYIAQLSLNGRTFTTKEGAERGVTDVRINRLVKF